MTAIVLTRYLHFIAVFAIVGAIIAEQFIISSRMSKKELKLMSKIDALYGIGALLVLVAGLILWFWVGKHAEFYTKNWIFHTKLTLFVLLGLLSIYPTIFFLKNSKGVDLDTMINVPPAVLICLRAELVLLIIIPVLATLMSLGIGSF